jgi:type I restriction enzyme S subunit
MKNCVSGAAIPRIILNDFKKFQIVIPPQHIMHEWNSIIELMVKQCWNLVSRTENLKKQRDMLLPKLISGDIKL